MGIINSIERLVHCKDDIDPMFSQKRNKLSQILKKQSNDSIIQYLYFIAKIRKGQKLEFEDRHIVIYNFQADEFDSLIPLNIIASIAYHCDERCSQDSDFLHRFTFAVEDVVHGLENLKSSYQSQKLVQMVSDIQALFENISRKHTTLGDGPESESFEDEEMIQMGCDTDEDQNEDHKMSSSLTFQMPSAKMINSVTVNSDIDDNDTEKNETEDNIESSLPSPPQVNLTEVAENTFVMTSSDEEEMSSSDPLVEKDYHTDED